MGKELSKEQALVETAQHWTRMYCWAKCQPETKMVDSYLMVEGIEESWFVRDCPLCTKYYVKQIDGGYTCTTCPLYLKHGRCGAHGVENLWGVIDNAIVWSEWVRAAKAFIIQLKAL